MAKTNKDLYDQLQKKERVENMLLEKLQIKSTGPKIALTSERMEAYESHIKSNFQAWQQMLTRVKETAETATIVVPQNFDIQDLFDAWSKDDDAYLFRSFGNNVRAYMLDWDVVFSSMYGYWVYSAVLVHGSLTLCFNIIMAGGRYISSIEDEAARKEMTADDEGGPTRAFLSEIWRQFGDLSVLGKNRVSLFERTVSGVCIVVNNDMLASKLGSSLEASDCARQYYRALGRIMLYSLRKNFPMAAHVMPDFYRNYLLRGISPESDHYLAGDLVQHVLAMQTTKVKEGTTKEIMAEMLPWFGTDDTGDTVKAFREAVNERYIKTCSMALEAMSEGLTMNGTMVV
jgi:hypothetical protein